MAGRQLPHSRGAGVRLNALYFFKRILYIVLLTGEEIFGSKCIFKKNICVIGLGLLGKPGCRKILVNTLNVLLSLFLLNILDFELGDIESKRKNVFLGYKNVFYLIEILSTCMSCILANDTCVGFLRLD